MALVHAMLCAMNYMLCYVLCYMLLLLMLLFLLLFVIAGCYSARLTTNATMDMAATTITMMTTSNTDITIVPTVATASTSSTPNQHNRCLAATIATVARARPPITCSSLLPLSMPSARMWLRPRLRRLQLIFPLLCPLPPHHRYPARCVVGMLPPCCLFFSAPLRLSITTR